jgi:hypothetical protein
MSIIQMDNLPYGSVRTQGIKENTMLKSKDIRMNFKKYDVGVLGCKLDSTSSEQELVPTLVGTVMKFQVP